MVNWIPKWENYTTNPAFANAGTVQNQPCNHICKKRQQWHDKCVQHFAGSRTMRIRHTAKAWYANNIAKPTNLQRYDPPGLKSNDEDDNKNDYIRCKNNNVVVHKNGANVIGSK